jgi:dihydropteroate synthase
LAEVIDRAGKMIDDGATILDVGGQSTRPGSEKISAGEEMERVLPVIELIHKHFPAQFISIDTYYGEVALHAVKNGASIVNDISAGTLDENMLVVMKDLHVPYVIMHMRGTPQTMQHQAAYDNVTLDIFGYHNQKIAALKAIGLTDLIVDPGFGFAKHTTHNFRLLKELAFFKHLNFPIMVGLSRKASIYKTLDITAEEALNGTTVLNTIAIQNGASILRVHDVKEAFQTIRLLNAIK